MELTLYPGFTLHGTNPISRVYTAWNSPYIQGPLSDQQDGKFHMMNGREDRMTIAIVSGKK